MNVRGALKIAMILMAMVCVLLLSAIGTAVFVLSTEKGLKWSVHFALGHFVPAQVKTVGNIEGSLSSSIVLDDITLKNFKNVYPLTLLIQQVVFKPHGMDYKNAELQIFNARLFMKYSDTVVVMGAYKNHRLNFNLFSTGVSLSDICRLASLKNMDMAGSINKINVHVLGTLTKPQLRGTLFIQKLSKQNYELSQSPVTMDLKLSQTNKGARVNGHITLDKGSLQSKNTKISLNKSSVFFNGEAQNPALAIDAYSWIEDVDIYILVNGTFNKPDVKLTSDPSYNPAILAAMLATGKKVPGLENLEQGKLSPELASELVGYLFFSGSNGGFLSQLGITDVHVIAQGGAEGIGFTKEVTPRFSLGYQVEENSQPQEPATLSQQLEADYRIANRFYLGAETQIGIPSYDANTPTENNFDFTLKYKRSF